MIRIDDRLALDDHELTFVASRSSGPGGQNVNKVATRITLLFDVEGSPNLDADQKGRLRDRLATRINKDGVLRVSSQRHRTQAANRDAATERFVDLVSDALDVAPERRPTRTPQRVHRRRLEEKRRRSRIKGERSRRYDERE